MISMYHWQTIDGTNVRGPTEELVVGEEGYIWRGVTEEGPRFFWPRRTKVEVEQMVEDAYRQADVIHEDAFVDVGHTTHESNGGRHENDIVNVLELENLISESTQPVYEGCPVSRLQACIVLMNMVNLYGVPYTFFDELLRFLAADLLPQSNCLPRNMYEMKSVLPKMGLEHQAIHCCPSGHILYHGPEHENLQECPSCGESRYVSGSDSIPQKVLRYFPIIPRLQRLFQCPEVATLLKWHATNKSRDENMRSVVDSKQWAAMHEIDPSFTEEENNLYLGMVADGVNPFGNQSTKYSMWPVLLLIYNLPPWLVLKSFFISLTLLIPGDRAPTPEAFDIFISPLVRDLQELWRGIRTVDSSN